MAWYWFMTGRTKFSFRYLVRARPAPSTWRIERRARPAFAISPGIRPWGVCCKWKKEEGRRKKREKSRDARGTESDPNHGEGGSAEAGDCAVPHGEEDAAAPITRASCLAVGLRYQRAVLHRLSGLRALLSRRLHDGNDEGQSEFRGRQKQAQEDRR